MGSLVAARHPRPFPGGRAKLPFLASSPILLVVVDDLVLGCFPVVQAKARRLLFPFPSILKSILAFRSQSVTDDEDDDDDVDD